jgi:hypothetical protein
MYNMTAIEQSNNLAQVGVGVNTASGGLLGITFLIALFVILFILLIRRNPAPESLAAASGVSTVVALIMLAAQLITMPWLIGASLMFAMSSVGLYLRNKIG